MPPPPSDRRAAFVVIAVFALVWTTLAMGSSAAKSATYDEPLHLVSGYAALARGDFRMDPSHPPLLRIVAALPLAIASRVPPDTRVIDSMPGREWLLSQDQLRLARRYVHDTVDPDRELARARMMIALLGFGLGVLVFLWAREWLGLGAGIFALGLYTLSPNMIAHGSLVTTDLGAAALMFGSVYGLWRLTRRWSPVNLSIFVLTTAAAALAKFSSLALAPVLVALIGIAVWRRTAIDVRRAVVTVAAVIVTTFVAIWAVHGFRYEPSATAGWVFHLHDHPAIIDAAPWTARVVGWIDGWHLLPNAFSEGLLYCLATSAQPAYLLGEHSTEGWWYYFPVAFLVKTPLAILALFAAGLYYAVKRFREDGALNQVFLFVPALGFAALAAASYINIGLRHMLPFYPFVFILGGAAAARWLRSPARLARPALAAVALVGVIDVASVYPRTLTFFNLVAGGPDRGLEYLSDSNLDWGQHLKALKTWMDEQGVESINLAYFGQADPAYYRIDCRYLTSSPWLMRRVTTPPRLPGFVAISATVQSGVYLPPEWRLFYQGFQDRERVVSIGNTINVYWVDQWPEPPEDGPDAPDPTVEKALADGLLRAANWPAHAVRHYLRYLRHRGDDVEARYSLGHARIASGDVDGGLDVLGGIAARNPRDVTARINLALAMLDTGHAGDALEHARAVTELLPNQAAGWRLYGRAFELTSRLREAEDNFLKAVMLDPDSAEARADLDRVRTMRRERIAGAGGR